MLQRVIFLICLRKLISKIEIVLSEIEVLNFLNEFVRFLRCVYFAVLLNVRLFCYHILYYLLKNIFKVGYGGSNSKTI